MKSKTFKDAIFDDVEIEIYEKDDIIRFVDLGGSGNDFINLTRKEAKKIGEYLVKLSSEAKKG